MAIRVYRNPYPQQPDQPQRSAQPIIAPPPPPGAAEALTGAAGQLAQETARIYREERDQEILTKVRELDIRRRQEDGAVLNSYLQAQGKDAVEQRQEASQRILANSKTMRGEITDKEVAKVWAQQDSQHTQAAIQDIDSHYRQQNLQWQSDTHRDRAEVLLQDMGRTAFGAGYDPATGALSIEAQRNRSAYRDEIAQRGKLMGADQASIELEQRAADTKGIGGVAESLIRQERYGEALKVLEAHGDQVDEGTRQYLGQAANRGQKLRQTQDDSLALSMKVIAKARAAQAGTISATIDGTRVTLGKPPDYDQLMRDSLADLEQQVAAPNGISPEVYDDAVRRVEHNLSRDRSLQATAENKFLDQVTNWLTNNLDQSYADLLPEWQLMLQDSGNDAKVKEFAAARRWMTTPEGLDRLMALEQDPERLNGLDLPSLVKELRPMLSNEHLDHVRVLWHEGNKVPVPKSLPADLVGSAIRLRAMDSWAVQGLTQFPKEEQALRMDRIETAVRRELYATTNGGPVTPEVLRTVLDGIYADQITAPDGVTLPRAALSGKEYEASMYQTDFGPVSPKVLTPGVLNEQFAKTRAVNDERRLWNAQHPGNPQPLLPEGARSAAQGLALEVKINELRSAAHESLVQKYLATLRPPFADLEANTPEEQAALQEARARIRSTIPATPAKIYTGFGGIK